MSTLREPFKIVRAGRLIDGRGGPTVDRGAVMVRGSKILAVGRASEVTAPDGAPVDVFDFPGKTVMPGMVDAHTHHIGFGDGRVGDDLVKLPDEVLTLQAAKNARSCLFTGVTSIRENGPKNYTMFRLRDAVNKGIVVGPRMVLCGRPVSIIGGHMGYFGSRVTGPTEARAMTRQLISEGADYIKITATGGSTSTSFPLRPSFDVDELLAITGEAHKFGKLTAAHCSSTQGTINSLDGGVDMIIHCIFQEPDGSTNFRQDVADRLGEQGAYINPTLHVGRAGIWALQQKSRATGLSPEEKGELEEALRAFDTRLEDCRRLIEMGLKVITGSDSSWASYQLGNTAYEAECLAIAGMPLMRCIQSVTSESARSLGIDDIVGTLETGKEADLIVVDGDPAADIRALWNVEEVFLAGQRINRGSDEALAAVRQHPPD